MNNELYHFGIKGQKWGVRRFQNKDGSLTPSGKKRYDDTPSGKKQYDDTPNAQIKKSKHRLKLEQQCKELGMTDKQARVAANKRIQIEKILAVSAGVAVTAAVATHVASKAAMRECTGIINNFFNECENDWNRLASRRF